MRTSFRTFKKRVLDEKKENHNQCEDRKEDMPKEESKKITNSILPVYEGQFEGISYPHQKCQEQGYEEEEDEEENNFIRMAQDLQNLDESVTMKIMEFQERDDGEEDYLHLAVHKPGDERALTRKNKTPLKKRPGFKEFTDKRKQMMPVKELTQEKKWAAKKKERKMPKIQYDFQRILEQAQPAQQEKQEKKALVKSCIKGEALLKEQQSLTYEYQEEYNKVLAARYKLLEKRSILINYLRLLEEKAQLLKVREQQQQDIKENFMSYLEKPLEKDDSKEQIEPLLKEIARQDLQ